MFDSLFGGGGDNPYEEALDLYSLEEFEAQLYKYLGPFIESGQMTLGELTDLSMMMMTNPQVVYDMLASGYEQSPGYQYSYDEAMNAQNQAAAAGGMAGTQQHQQYAANTATGMASQDFNTYMQQMGKILGGGMQAGGGIAKGGYQASSQMAQDLARFMGAQMGLTTQAANWENQQSQQLLNTIGGMGTMAAGAYMGNPMMMSSGAKMTSGGGGMF